MDEAKEAVKIFYSYAPEDRLLRDELDKHLSTLQWQKKIKGWFDRDILAGSDRALEIEAQLNSANIILLLVSPDFISSEYCYGVEVMQALQRHEAREAHVIPIILRPVDWTGTPFAQLQALPTGTKPTSAKPVTDWRNRDKAWQNVANGIKKVVEELLATRAPAIQPASAANVSLTPQVWNVPYRRNPFFTGREELLKQLNERLTIAKSAALTQTQAINGLGGVGKTQTTIEYAYRYRNQYRFVFWVRATSRDLLFSNFVLLADLLHLSDRVKQDQDKVVTAVKHWFATHADWLLILDNADDLTVVDDFLPTVGNGHILLTTRARATGRIAPAIEVDKMSEEEGMLLLLRRAKLLAPDTSPGQALEENRTEAEAIIKLLDGLPLALDQAGAYIEETGCSLREYLDLYHRHHKDLLQWRSKLPSDYPESVVTTWSLSFQKVEQENHAAIALLQMCAFLAPEEIPEEILTQGAPYLGDELSPIAQNAFMLNDIIEVLQQYSLMQRYRKRKTLSMHRLIQTVIKDSIEGDKKHLWATRVVRAVNEVFPFVEFASWSQCQSLLPHAQTCSDLIDQHNVVLPEAARLLYELGFYWYEHAKYEQAKQLYQQASHLCEVVWSPDHIFTAYVLDELANVYQAQAEYEQAELLYQRALQMKREHLGSDHPENATTLHALAVLYQAQGKYEQAGSFYQQALDLYEATLEPEHPDKAIILNEQATLYRIRGYYEQSEALYGQALRIYVRTMGLEHPVVASALNELATLYQLQGKYSWAQYLYQEALRIFETTFGPEHPSAVSVLYRLALLYHKQSNDEQAEALYQRVLDIRSRTIGLEHSIGVAVLLQLAELYQGKGEDTRANDLYQQALRVYNPDLNSEQLDTANILYSLARFNQKQGRYEQATPLYKQALDILQKVLGSHHSIFANVQHSFALLYRQRGQYEEAKELFFSALATRKVLFGEVHPHVVTTLSELAEIHRVLENYDQAKSYSQQALNISEKLRQAEQLDVPDQFQDLAHFLRLRHIEITNGSIIQQIWEIRMRDQRRKVSPEEISNGDKAILKPKPPMISPWRLSDEWYDRGEKTDLQTLRKMQDWDKLTQDTVTQWHKMQIWDKVTQDTVTRRHKWNTWMDWSPD